MTDEFPGGHEAALSLLREAADAGGRAAMAHFRRGAAAADKGGDDFDPVTAADTEGEAAIRAVIARRAPHLAVLGEEQGRSAAEGAPSGWTAVIDPVDGTRAFVAGLASWTVLIALEDAERTPRYGAIAAPVLGEFYLGWPGGASLEIAGAPPEPITVSRRSDLREAVISTTDPFILSPSEQGAWTHLRAAARLSRYGLDAYAYARLAAGTVDLVAESLLARWDASAVVPVVRGAGGIAADWRGGDAKPGAPGGQLVCACSQAVLDQALLALRRSAV